MINEKTSKRVASIAGRILRDTTHRNSDLVCFTGPVKIYWRDVRALAASALTQAGDARIRAGYDETGFDPRDGGKVGKQRVPRQPKNNS